MKLSKFNMKKINYQHFTVQCALEEPVTTDNFWKYDIQIFQYKDNKFENVVIIPRTILCRNSFLRGSHVVSPDNSEGRWHILDYFILCR